MTYDQACQSLPLDAKWSASFGYPGQGGYTEYHRTPSGERWTVSNGSYLDSAPFAWHAEQVRS